MAKFRTLKIEITIADEEDNQYSSALELDYWAEKEEIQAKVSTEIRVLQHEVSLVSMRADLKKEGLL